MNSNARTFLFSAVLSAMALAILPSSTARAADVFDRHTLAVLNSAIEGQSPRMALGLDEAVRLKTLGANFSSPCIIVRTNDGNTALALVGWGFRRGTDGPLPVVLIERYVTWRSDRPDVTASSGQDVMLFAGFSFNFDIGQVVPDGQGGDLTLTSKASLEPLDRAKLYVLDGSAVPETDAATVEPEDHDGVLPSDFAGQWDVNIDGRWKGEWNLELKGPMQLEGIYLSDESRSRYRISGRVGQAPNRARLTIELANSSQQVDALLWTTDKSTMAGSVTIAGQRFGFCAVRQKSGEKSDSPPGE
ncbi:MAG: hypothetical protein KDA79_21015 [Planctomycetaceae bacterium]|nr:hypothetical protein [Planctomycetaceae bacterium]